MKLDRSLSVVFASCALAYCVTSWAQSLLNAKQLNALIVGKTIHGQHLQRGYSSRSYFDPSGKFLLEIPERGSVITGVWLIRPDGALCVTLAAQLCSRIQRNADGTYTRMDDGVPMMKWSKVTAGSAIEAKGPPGDSVSFQSLTFPVGVGLPLAPALEEGRPETVSAFLSLPAGDNRVPAVVLMHGCGGLSGAEIGWANAISRLGVATLVIDSFRPRGISETCTGKEFLHSAGALLDAYRALDFLATNQRIDPSRIAIMGASLGGQHALWTSLVRVSERYGSEGKRFAAYLALYPAGCITRLEDEDRVEGGPIRIFHGEMDDWTRITPCKEYVERLRQSGKDAALIAYAGAYHSFDDASLPLQKVPGVRNPANCSFVERDGRVVDPVTGFNAQISSCWSRGVTVGYNADAHRKAVDDVQAFLKMLYRLN